MPAEKKKRFLQQKCKRWNMSVTKANEMTKERAPQFNENTFNHIQAPLI